MCTPQSLCEREQSMDLPYSKVERIDMLCFTENSLAVLVFSRGANLSTSSTLIFGENAKDRFSVWLFKIAKQYKEELLCLGISIEDIGSHSFRKGVASELCNTPGGPSPISVMLRAGWSLGPVQGRYIFSGAGGDQYVGRAAAGYRVSQMSYNFIRT